MTEVEKYIGIYNTPTLYPTYGHSNHGEKAIPLIIKWNVSSIIDVGCGYNEFLNLIKTQINGLPTLGVDFACPGADLIANADNLPVKDKEYDLLSAFDTLEHIPIGLVNKTLKEFNRVSKKFIFSISFVDSKNKWKGETLHPTVRSEDWWIHEIIKAGGISIKKWGRYIYGNWQTMPKIKSTSKVILVGNGPNILSEPKGHIIDSYDEIVRFNNFQIQNYENFTGSKTTLWSTFFKADSPMAEKHDRILCTHEKDVPNIAHKNVYHISSIFYNKIWNDVRRRVQWSKGLTADNEPKLLATSGLMVAAWFLNVIEVDTIDLIGFDHFSKEKSGMHHYWINKSFKRPSEHNGDIEKQMFGDLVLAGRVRYI